MTDTTRLYTLCEHIRRVVALNFSAPVWVIAEIARIDVSKGHIYLELVEQTAEGAVVAQVSAFMWAADVRRLHRQLGPTIGAVLQPGQEVRLHAKPDFHEKHGLKLLIDDVDPAHTFGQWELQRQQTLAKLQAEGLLQLNRDRTLPPVLQRLAIISSADAAGLQDFRMQLAQNVLGYRFEGHFFHTTVQGQDAPTSITAALKTVAQQADYFDAVVLLRGGGSRLDLMAFDQWVVCEAIARMPIPVLTGIGHETDATLADQVAFRALRTPTAAATFILQHNEFFGIKMAGLMADLAQYAQRQIIVHRQNLQRDYAALQWSSSQQLRATQQQLAFVQQTLPVLANHQLSRLQQQLHTAQVAFETLHPDTTLKRGFAMVTRSEKVIGSATDTAPGDALTVHFIDGRIKVNVQGL